MLKKALAGTAGLVVVAALILGPGTVYSHVKGLVGWVRTSVEEALPPEYELERAERLLAEIDPAIAEQEVEVAREKVEIRDLKGAIATEEARLDHAKGVLAARHTALKTLRVSTGRESELRVLEGELQTLLLKYKQLQTRLEGRKSLLEQREKALQASIQNLGVQRAEKERLVLFVEELRVQIREMKAVEEAGKEPQMDDGKLAEIRATLEKIDKQLRVKRQLNEDRGRVDPSFELKPDQPSGAELSREIDEILGGAQEEGEDF